MNELLIVNCGSRYTSLIYNVLRKLNINFQSLNLKLNGSNVMDEIIKREPEGIIITGSPNHIYEKKAGKLPAKFTQYITDTNTPTLGICYGHQMLAYLFEGIVTTFQDNQSEKGEIIFHTNGTSDPLFSNLEKEFTVYMAHKDAVTLLPYGFKSLGYTKKTKFAAIRHANYDIYGVQFHPENSSDPVKETIFRNFTEIIQ